MSCTSFAVLGGDNAAIEKEIDDLEQKVGSIEGKTGLSFALHLQAENARKIAQDLQKADQSRLKFLRDFANTEIKLQPHLYGEHHYNITKVQADIDELKSKPRELLSEDDDSKYRLVAKQEPLNDIPLPSVPMLALDSLYASAQDLLQRRIAPTEAITELLEDAALQEWVKQGRSLHRGKRKDCSFCGSPLSSELWQRLDSHFSEASIQLEKEIDSLIQKLSTESRSLQDCVRQHDYEVYPDLQTKLTEAKGGFFAAVEKARETIDLLTNSLLERKRDLFTAKNVPEATIHDDGVRKAFTKVADVVQAHKKATGELADKRKSAQSALRLNEVKKFMEVIDLVQQESRIATLQTRLQDARKEEGRAKQSLDKANKEIENCRRQLKDERRGAESVNKFLANHFGHDSLRLEAIEPTNGGEEGVRFEVWRGENRAFNLSEGECSLIAFCYFIAKLEDVDAQGKELVIYIDDPICSLDADHIFFAFGLMQATIGKLVAGSEEGDKPEAAYRQLFISTHNLDFLKFLQRLNGPGKGGKECFMTVKTESGSVVEPMPHYLRMYVTEFHYLFDQICACTEEGNVVAEHHCFYSFGNNLRKFLEVYLFFRFPFCSNGDRDYDDRVKRFFNEDPAIEPLVVRLTNELSHGGQAFDRCIKPIAYAEINKLAFYILRKIKEADGEQYLDLLQATGRADPLAA